MAMYKGFWTEGITEIVKVVEVGYDGVLVKDSRNGRFRANFSYIDPTAPRIGEYWYATNKDFGRWQLLSKYDLRQRSLMSFGVLVNARSCVGIEESVVMQLTALDVDEVWLVAGADGRVYWDSAVAEKYGLKKAADTVSVMVSRLRARNIVPILCIDSGLWNDVENEVHNRYQQERYMSGTMPDIIRSYEPLLSPLKAKSAVASLAGELAAIPKVGGVALLNVGLKDAATDYAPLAVSSFYSKERTHPPLEVDTGSEAWWKWQEFREASVESLVSETKKAVGSLSFAVTLASKPWTVGRVAHGIGDEFAKRSGSSIVCVAVEIGGTTTTALGSMEFQFAVASAIGGKAPVVSLKASDILAISTLLETTARYESSRVIIDSYDDIIQASPIDRARLREAVSAHRMLPKADSPKVAILCSSDTRDVGNGESLDYAARVEHIAGLVAVRSGFRLAAVFDKDLENLDKLLGVRTLLLIDTKNMTQEAVSNLNEWLSREDRKVVATGLVGYNVGRTLATRIPPLWARFRAQYVGVSSVDSALGTNLLSPVSPDTTFSTRTWQKQQVNKVESAMDDGFAMLVSGRNVLVGADIHNSDDTCVFVADLAIYSACR